MSYIPQQGKSGQLVTTTEEVGKHALIHPESALFFGNAEFFSTVLLLPI